MPRQTRKRGLSSSSGTGRNRFNNKRDHSVECDDDYEGSSSPAAKLSKVHSEKTSSHTKNAAFIRHKREEDNEATVGGRRSSRIADIVASPRLSPDSNDIPCKVDNATNKVPRVYAKNMNAVPDKRPTIEQSGEVFDYNDNKMSPTSSARPGRSYANVKNPNRGSPSSYADIRRSRARSSPKCSELFHQEVNLSSKSSSYSRVNSSEFDTYGPRSSRMTSDGSKSHFGYQQTNRDLDLVDVYRGRRYTSRNGNAIHEEPTNLRNYSESASATRRDHVENGATSAHDWRQNFAVPCTANDGHYIVRLGSVIRNRYKITKLLGQGTFGKVVEVLDIEYRTKHAIKIIRAIEKYRNAAMTEIYVLETIESKDVDACSGCITLQDWFDFNGHICLVFDLYSISLFDFMKSNQFTPFTNSAVFDFAFQILSSLKFLHSVQLIHTDLKPENLMLKDSRYRILANRVKSLLNTELVLIDFGSAAIFKGTKLQTVVSTRHYRAPEIVLDSGWSFPCDIWSLGCILVELYTGKVMFQTHDNSQHLALMERILGKFDRKFISSLKDSASSLFKDGALIYPASVKRYAPYQKARALSTIISPTNKQERAFLDLVRKMLQYDPEKRITAAEALRHPLFETMKKG